jgi:hypothetical protein
MANFRETGRGLVVADILFSAPVIWCFIAVGEFVWAMTQSAAPETLSFRSSEFQFQSPASGSDFHPIVTIAFAALGSMVSQVCFFMSRRRPPATPVPLWNFRLLTLIVGVLSAGGLSWLMIGRNALGNNEYRGWPYVYYVFDNNNSVWSKINLYWDLVLCTTLVALVMLLIEYLMVRPNSEAKSAPQSGSHHD